MANDNAKRNTLPGGPALIIEDVKAYTGTSRSAFFDEWARRHNEARAAYLAAKAAHYRGNPNCDCEDCHPF